MTRDEIFLFYIHKNCLVIPNNFATQIYPEGENGQIMAVLFENMVIFKTAECNVSFKIEDLTENLLMKMYNEFFLIEKKKKIIQRKHEIQMDFINEV